MASYSNMGGQGKDVKPSNFRFVLVHWACFGAWCRYKRAGFLIKAGHSVSSLDMAGGGIDPTDADRITTLEEYNRPLTDFFTYLSSEEKAQLYLQYALFLKFWVILVGHSAGGYNLSFTMESFPHKIVTAVFVAAVMPLSGSTLSEIMDEVLSRIGSFKDTTFYYANGEDRSPTSLKFGHQCSDQNLLQNSPSSDRTFCGSLLKRFPLWQEALTYSNENYGNVFRAYVITKEDLCIVEELQRKIIADNPPHLVYEIEDFDHSPFFSYPNRLVHILLQIRGDKSVF